MVMLDTEDVLKFINSFWNATKHVTTLGVKLKDEKIVENYCIVLKDPFPELRLYFHVHNTINFEEIKNLAWVLN